jgi:hypothetical protein
MGNTSKAASDALTPEFLKDHEYSSGHLLLRSIKVNSKKQLTEAIEIARKELLPLHRSNLKLTHDEEYERMQAKMVSYLTRKYDIGEGYLNRRTPIEYAIHLGGNIDEVIDCLKENITILSRTLHEKKISVDKAPRTAAAVGRVDRDRVALAKARLESLRNGKNPDV